MTHGLAMVRGKGPACGAERGAGYLVAIQAVAAVAINTAADKLLASQTR